MHLRTLDNLSRDEIEAILDRSADLKARFRNGEREPILAGRTLSLLFEKPSLRTRASFAAAMTQLGGGSTYLTSKEAGLHGREELRDVARVLSSMSDAVAMRTFSQQLIEDFAAHASCPVINALSDERHPCQALTDVLTLREHFDDLTACRLVYIGDGNNIARSLATAAAILGIPLSICTPPDYALDDATLADLGKRHPSAAIDISTDPVAAVTDADVVYTDVWASMGQESEADGRRKTFAPYQVNAALMSKAPSGCLFMHDMPAHRGEEVTGDVIDGPQSIAFQQAENRMHLAKGLLAWLLLDAGR
jgi:ornithine carbamoyltransferase